MTYCTGKERQTNSSLFEKALSLKSKKYCSPKIGYLSVYYDTFNFLNQIYCIQQTFILLNKSKKTERKRCKSKNKGRFSGLVKEVLKFRGDLIFLS